MIRVIDAQRLDRAAPHGVRGDVQREQSPRATENLRSTHNSSTATATFHTDS